MAARRRTHKTKDLPPNLYCRNGYYSFRDPRSGKEFGLGRDKRIAVNEAVSANISIFNEKRTCLVDKINNVDIVTLHEWIDKYQLILKDRCLKEKTISDYRDRIKRIKSGLEDEPINSVSTKKIADFLIGIEMEGKKTTAKLIRSLLVDIFKEAISSGVIESNPASLTRQSKATVSRSRLSISTFIEILEFSYRYDTWVRNSLLIAIVTGQRVGDISSMMFSDIVNGSLRVEQKKTGAKIAIRLSTMCKAVGMTLSDVIDLCRINNDTGYLIADRNGSPLNPKKISHQFLSMRDKLNFDWEGTPASFHEIRSLSARVYAEQEGSEFAQRILGHKSSAMTDKYRDTRGIEWTSV